jgi:O-acetyl-ADP-ribose deacetylase (regulator of RNase III)
MEALAVKRFDGTTVVAVQGDLTRQPVAVVVNAANENLRHDEGVATAIVRTGGRVIQEESDVWVRDNGPLVPGVAATTTGGMLQASHVVHVVGPVFGKTELPAAALAASVRAALDAVVAAGLDTVALPAISTGKRAYPAHEAIPVIVSAVGAWLADHPDDLTEIRLVGFTRADARLFASELEAFEPVA